MPKEKGGNAGKIKKRNRERGRPRKTYSQQLSQAHFNCVEFYMQGMSKTEAMLKAGYSRSMAEKAQWKVFDRDDVRAAIEERRWALKTRNNKITDRIQEELARIAFFNIGTVIEVTEQGEFVYDFSEATMEDFAAIGEVTVETYQEGRGNEAQEVKRIKVKPYDKKAALDSLARIHGMFNDNITVNPGEGGSLEERLAAGRKRLNAPDVIDGEYTEVSD